MHLEITKPQFIEANMLTLDQEVKNVYYNELKKGLRIRLLSVSKSNKKSTLEYLSILIGRLACLTEEWDHHSFNDLNWANVYQSSDNNTADMPREFMEISPNLFEDKLLELQQEEGIVENINDLDKDILTNNHFECVYKNKNQWNWQLWYAETKENAFLYEELITH